MAKVKKYCYLTKNEIDFAFKNARLSYQILGLKLLEAPLFFREEITGKILIVIPKRFGNACKRNKLKRQIKSIFHEEKLYNKPILSILIAYKQAKDLSFDDIKTFLVHALQK